MKTKSYDQLVIDILIGTVASVLIDVLLSYAFYTSLLLVNSDKPVGLLLGSIFLLQRDL
jgi:uncharacterized membrane protein